MKPARTENKALMDYHFIDKGVMPDGISLSPVVNMAIDSWMAEAAPLELNESILRIYRWGPAGISIGRNQSWNRALDIDCLGAGEIAVRRITGGRAIFHDSSELTYSFVTAISEKKAYSTKSSDQLSGLATVPSYESCDPLVAQGHISGAIVSALLSFLRRAGLDAKVEQRSGYVPAHRVDRSSPHCFVSSARHEITVNGIKIVASAQRIKNGRFFQHGSIKLTGAVRHPALFERPAKEIDIVGNNITPNGRYTRELGVEDSSSHNLTALDPIKLRAAFQATFGQRLTPPSFTSQCWEEVSRRTADNDIRVGSPPRAKWPKRQSGQIERLIPQNDNPHGDNPHRDNQHVAGCDEHANVDVARALVSASDGRFSVPCSREQTGRKTGIEITLDLVSPSMSEET